MLNIKGIDHINLNVTNLSKSIDFYTKLFGFHIAEKGLSPISGAEYAIIGHSNKAFLALYLSDKASELNHIGFNVENFDDVMQIVKEQGLKVGPYGDENGVVNYPKSKSIYIYDPDNIEIEISSHFGGGL